MSPKIPSFKLGCLSVALLSVHVAYAAENDHTDTEVQSLSAIVISASKQGEKLEKLNGAASVVERYALDDAQVNDTVDLGRVFPDLQMSYSGSPLFPQVTIRGVTSAQDFYNPALTVYVDGVPQLPVAALQSLVDVERVELLKGPQGTLYGKSAQGGVLNIVTRQPDNDFQAQLKTGLSNRHGYQVQGSVSGPLVEDLLYGSVSLLKAQTPYWLESDVLGNKLARTQAEAGTFKLRLAPVGSPWEMGISGGRDCAKGAHDVYTPYDNIDDRTAYAWADLPEAYRDVYQRRCVNSLTGSGQYQWDDWQLNAIVNTQHLRLEREYPFAMQYSWQPEQWRQDVQELRLSTRPQQVGGIQNRSWDGVFGLYRQKVKQARQYKIDMVVPNYMPYLESNSKNETESLAAYGNMTWHVTPKLDLTGGLRLSRDSAKTNFGGHMGGVPVHGDKSTHENTWLAHVAAGYQFTDAWRGYVNVAQGYKPAGYNLAPTSMADAEGFGRERSTSYEIGARYTTDDVRFSVAAYRVNSKDTQLYGDSQMGYQTLKNVGKTRSTGLEFNAEWDVSQSLTLAASGFINDAKFVKYVANTCTGCEDNRVPFTPSHGLTIAAKGNVRVGNTNLRPQVAVRRTGSLYFDSANTLKQEGYTLLDASVAWNVSDSVELAAYIHNVTDRKYRTYGFSYGALGNFAQVAPGRVFGLTATWMY